MENTMNITTAQYQKDFEVIDDVAVPIGENLGIKATIDGIEMSVPLCEGNRHYDEIMRQVDAGTLTIEDAE